MSPWPHAYPSQGSDFEEAVIEGTEHDTERMPTAIAGIYASLVLQ